MKKLLLLLLAFPLLGLGQTLYNPQDLYDSPAGFFDEDSIRSIHLNFYNAKRAQKLNYNLNK